MKQVTQRLGDGRVEVLDVPLPSLGANGVLVRVRASLVSAGTERSKIATGKQSLIQKARSRPDQVAAVVEKARRDGLRETLDAVRSRLAAPSPLGYSSAGVVLAVGERVLDLAPGDRVACGGGGYAVHAEVDHVPGNLCVRLPAGVSLEAAAFATVGSIALHGVRQADVRIGERVAVIGLGLVGALTGMLLRAAGCTVVGVDLDGDALGRALDIGSIDEGRKRDDLDPGRLPVGLGGCDAVIACAATESADPIELAAALCRDRGRVVVVGDVGLDVPRAPYYDRELDIRFSRSYGPGRYDAAYEERGLDYPIGYVRWTERRNMEAFVGLIAAGRINVAALVSERVPLEDAPAALERLLTSGGSPLGVIIEYRGAEMPSAAEAPPGAAATRHALRVGLIGAGSFAQRVVIPGLRDAGFALGTVASATGLSAQAAAERHPFDATATPEAVIADPGNGLIVIATRHGSHASLAISAMRAGAAVYVEKPPFLTRKDLQALRAARDATGRPLFVGFNRRHAPAIDALRGHLAATDDPVEVMIRVNAPALPADHWLNDLDEGGGRLLGEGCHFIDLACWIAGATPARVACVARPAAGESVQRAQSFGATLSFANGSLATVLYASGGARGLGKEYVEAHAGGRSVLIDDFRRHTLWSGSKSSRPTGSRQDKGHRAQFRRMRSVLEGMAAPDPLDALDSMAVTLAALDCALTGTGVVSLE